MIICLTPNPAIDRTILLPYLHPGAVHRARKVIVAAGGKGLNVARAIRILGGEPFCMGFAGGHSGQLLEELAQEEGINFSWTQVEAETRTCMILLPEDGDATVINEPGAPVASSGWRHLQEDLRSSASSARLVCISGSLPPHSPMDDFRTLLAMLVENGKQVWVDTSGASLEAALAQPGICIKVNGEEIGRALGFEVSNPKSAQHALRVLIERGVTASVVTLGAAGALLATKEERWHARGPRVRVVSSVGSGDSFLGGFANALDQRRGWRKALGDAIAAGTANTLSAGGGRFTLQQFQEIREQVKIEDW